jgi:DNA-directed RNA polymerase specialized sigma24 family protein
MSKAKHSTSPAPYASSDDFRRVFHEETDSLYRLAFLLTADGEKAQQCFVSGLEDSVNGSAVFKDWAHSWARRTIIQNAVRAINPRPMEEHAPSSFDSGGTTLAAEQVETAAVLQLEPFERFVFVMSVLERYSDLDCSLLLGCARREVIGARIRVSQQIEMQSTFTLSARQMGLNRASTGDLS